MGKGLKTKGGRLLMFITQVAAHLFNPNGKRTICANFEEYTYEDGTEYDKIKRQGAKALFANAPLEGMHMGTAKGPLDYALIDDQILPYLVARPFSDITADGWRTREYRRPQFDRADRPFFAVQEGLPTDCELGCFGLFTGFKFSSKRGNKGTARFDLSFVTQTAVPYGAMVGTTPQNSKWRIDATAVTGDLVLTYLLPGAGATKQVTIAIADTAGQTKGKFEANSDGVVVSVVGTIDLANGELHVLAANSALGNATIYGTVVVTPGMTAVALQAAIRALGGAFANVTVTGSTTTPVKVNRATIGSGVTWGVANAANAFDSNDATSATINAANDIQNGSVAWVFNNPTVINAVRSRDGLGNAVVLASQTGDFTDAVTLKTFNGGSLLVADTTTTFANNTAYKAYALRSLEGFTVTLRDVQFLNDGPTSGSYNIQFPNAAGNVTDIAAAPGTGWTGSTTPMGSSGGSILVEFTTPANGRVILAKVSGHAGYVLTEAQPGSDGNFISLIPEANPVLPGHIYLYRSDTLAGLDDSVTPTKSNASALVGKIQEWDFDDSKIVEPVSHHVPINDPLRPNLPPTYDSFAEVETEEDGPKLTVTLDCDDVTNGDVTTLLTHASAVAGGGRYISKPSYWRVEATSPKDGSRIRNEFYGSIGQNIPRKFGGNIEQRTFVLDLIENREQPFALRWVTRVPA